MSAVTLAPEIIFSVSSIKVTNAVLGTIATDIILLSLVFAISRNIKQIPGKLQIIAEIFISSFYSLTRDICGRFTNSIFPWFASFFIFIFFANLFGLLPGVGSIGLFFHEHGEEVFVPLLRPATSDFNATLGLATVSLLATHFLAIKYNGIVEYLKKFFSLNPIYLFVGLLELTSEITKVVSLSFRLFGNIYAGEVVIHTITNLFAFVAPIPFLLLEMIVAFVQALVFGMLTMVFMSILVKPHREEAH